MKTDARRVLAPDTHEPIPPREPPTFSIIVAAFNAADTIGAAIDSALQQTIAPHEIVVCDDGSTDDLPGALHPYAAHIVVLHQENRGEASAKNAAARAASGEFVVILDADDLYLPDRLAALSGLAVARPDLDILTTDAWFELEGRRLRRCYDEGWTFEVDDQRNAILQRNFIFGLAAVRRDRLLEIGGFDEDIRWTTDWDCWARLILDGSRAGLVDEPLALYRLREGSLTAQRSHLRRGRISTLEKAATHPSLSPAESDVVARSIARERRELELSEAREALSRGGGDGRRRALAIARNRSFDARTRVKAAVAVLAPAAARRLLTSRDQSGWTAAGGLRIRRVSE